jgi:apolipoprotein N-acyltransferase
MEAPERATAPGPAGTGRAWRRLLHGPFRTLVTGQALGQAADGLAQIAFAQFVVFEVGRGATPGRIAALLAVTLLPFSLVGPFAGVVIDRWARRKVLVSMSLLRSALTLAAVATVAVGSEPGAFVGVLLLLSTSRFVLAAKGAALPRTVPLHELVPANAISAVAGMVAVFVGAVGGAAFVGWSAEAGFVLATLLYIAAAATFIRLPDVGGGDGRMLLRRLRLALVDVVDGVRALGNPRIGRPLGAVALHRLLLGAGFVLLVLVADSQFGLEVSGYGLALAVTGVAAFAGSLAAPACARRWSPVALLPLAFLPPAVALYAGGLAPNLVVLVAGLGVTALSFQLLKVLVDALVGGATADKVRGRVFSVYDVLYNVAFVLAGLLMVPLWDPSRIRPLLWWLAAAFLAAWLVFARLLGVWPFASRARAPRPTRRWRGRVLALLAGAVPVLAFPEPAWWWFAWVGLVPLLLVLRASPTAREAAVRGWWVGAGYIASSAYWLAPVTGPALVLVAFGLGLLWVPWGWAVWRMLAGRSPTRTLLGGVLVLPSGWVAVEAVRSWQSLGGPWALLGVSQWNQPALLASAALGGVWLTGFLVVAVNVALVVLLLTDRARARGTVAVLAVSGLAVGPVWAAGSPEPDPGDVVRVGIVQPGDMGGPDGRLERQFRLTEELAPEQPDLVVWGESSVGYDLARSPALVGELVDLTRRTDADVLVNVDALTMDGRILKTSVLVTSDGLDGSYVKTRLVPFGEYIPLRRVLGWVARVSDAAEVDRGRGEGQVVMRSGEVTFGPLICFESTFPDMARRQVGLGSELLVYQTASTTFQGTWAQPQHAAVAAVRAVETGRPVVHVALTGTTAAFDERGRLLLWVTPGEQTSAVVDLTLADGRTPYAVAGDWVLVLAAMVIVAGLVAASLSSGSARLPSGDSRDDADDGRTRREHAGDEPHPVGA